MIVNNAVKGKRISDTYPISQVSTCDCDPSVPPKSMSLYKVPPNINTAQKQNTGNQDRTRGIQNKQNTM